MITLNNVQLKKNTLVKGDTIENLTLFVYGQKQHENAYKFYIQGNNKAYRAFRTNTGIKNFIGNFNVKLKLKQRIETELNGICLFYEIIGTIKEYTFSSLSDIPTGSKVFKDLHDGFFIDCYYYHTEKGCNIYRPAPAAKEFYKPLSAEKHIEYMYINQ